MLVFTSKKIDIFVYNQNDGTTETELRKLT